MTELVDAALRRLLDRTSPVDTHAAPPWNAPPFPTIDTKRLKPAPPRTLSIAELNDLAKETELESDLERYDATFRH